MSGYDSLKARLDFYGGATQYDRMVADKLRSLRKALLYSYQSNICTLNDGREFLCLINKDVLNPDYDHKILSIPFEDINIKNKPDGSEKTIPGRETIGLKCGDVFQWKQNGTYWIIYMQYLEEKAYFRADIRYCEQKVEIGNNTYHVYWKGPSQELISWSGTEREEYNNLNYTTEMYITKNEETLKALKRFTLLKVAGNMWEVQAVNEAYGEGIIRVRLKEYFNSAISEKRAAEKEQEPVVTTIINPTAAKPFETVTFEVTGVSGGTWSYTNSKYFTIDNVTDTTITLTIKRTISGTFTLRYTVNDTNYDQVITIESL